MENFFGLLKNEFYYVNYFPDEKSFLKGLSEYISYYNNERIKLRLGMSPAAFRKLYCAQYNLRNTAQQPEQTKTNNYKL